MIEIAVDLCKTIVEVITKSNEIKKTQKKNISEVLTEISLILQDTADQLKQDIYPHGNCVVLERLSHSFCDLIGSFVTEQQLNVLRSSLMESSFIEKYYHSRNDASTIPQIERASGEFRAMSILMKI